MVLARTLYGYMVHQGRVWFLASHLHRTHHAFFAMFGRLRIVLGQARLLQNRPPSQAELARKFRPFPRACTRACKVVVFPPALAATLSSSATRLDLAVLPPHLPSPSHVLAGGKVQLSSPLLQSQALTPPFRP